MSLTCSRSFYAAKVLHKTPLGISNRVVMTESEKLFERFCSENGVSFLRIPRADENGIKSPDYEISIEDNRIAVEVKQFDPNPNDKEYQKQLEEEGITDIREGMMTKRIRGKIKDAMPQLKIWAKKEIPALIILYKNIPLDVRFIWPHNILQAMYGEELLKIVLPNDRLTAPYVKNAQFGGKRKVAPKYNTSLSAIVSFYEDWEQHELHADFYHNIFSLCPFDPDWFRRQRVRHFKLTDSNMKEFSGWIEI
jgi:hypothetical protein